MENYEKKTEELLIELAKQDELKNKKLLTNMWVLLITSGIFYAGILTLAAIAFGEGTTFGIIVCVSTIILVAVCFYGLKLELDAGYYECKKCHHKFIPTYLKVLIAPHMGTTRYLKCPKCNKITWSKKVMKK